MEFLGRETVEVCRGCQEVLARAYWRVDGEVVCGGCAEERRRKSVAEGWRRVERGLMFGWVAAVVAALGQAGAWGLLARINVRGNAWMLRSYLGMAVALGAGVLVGAAVWVGSRGRGGVVLQGTAAALVYLAAAGSVAVWQGGWVGAMGLRALLGPVLVRGPMDVPRMVDAVFAMGMAWTVNREGRRVAISGPFGYGGRGGSGSPLPGRRSHSLR